MVIQVDTSIVQELPCLILPSVPHRLVLTTVKTQEVRPGGGSRTATIDVPVSGSSNDTDAKPVAPISAMQASALIKRRTAGIAEERSRLRQTTRRLSQPHRPHHQRRRDASHGSYAGRISECRCLSHHAPLSIRPFSACRLTTAYGSA